MSKTLNSTAIRGIQSVSANLDLKEVVSNLNKSWHEFKATNERQYNSLERRIDGVETMLARPGSFSGGHSSPSGGSTKELEAKAIRSFLQHGDKAGFKEIQASLTTQSDPGGGYVVLPSFSKEMTVISFETSPLRKLARVVDIQSDTFEEIVDKDDAGANWVGETESRDETDTPGLALLKIPVHEIAASPRVSQKLVEDSTFDIMAWLLNKVQDKFSRTENTAFITGNGVKKPRGILTYPVSTDGDLTRTWGTLQYVASGAAGAFAASNPADKLLELVYALKAEYRTGAGWMMPRSVALKVRQIKDGQGNYIWQTNNKEGEPDILHGFPVYYAEDMPELAADSLSVAFGNFKRGYTIVDRIGVRFLNDPYTAKPFVILYTYKRVGGDVNDFHAIKLMKFAAS